MGSWQLNERLIIKIANDRLTVPSRASAGRTQRDTFSYDELNGAKPSILQGRTHWGSRAIRSHATYATIAGMAAGDEPNTLPVNTNDADSMTSSSQSNKITITGEFTPWRGSSFLAKIDGYKLREIALWLGVTSAQLIGG